MVEQAEGLDIGMDELLEAWAELEDKGGINKEVAMIDFIDVDSELITGLVFLVLFFLMFSITGGALTLEEIVAEVSAVEQEDIDVSDSEPMEEEAEEAVITRQEAQKAFNLVRLFVEKNCDDPAILSYSDKLDEFFYQERKKNEKQRKVTDFFSIV